MIKSNFPDTAVMMHLAEEPFRQIACGEKTVEVRLLDDKRKGIHVGDTIIFSRCENTEDIIRAQVVALHRSLSFQEFFSTEEMRIKTGFKGMTADSATVKMHQYYTEEQEQKYGVLGIEVTVLSDNNIKVSVSGDLAEDALKILCDYKEFWLQLESLTKYEPIEWGINIVKALDFAYKNYGGFQQRFISELFMFDFIQAFGKEEWFSFLLCADSIPHECKPRCLYGSNMVGEYIYGGIPSVFPLADIAEENCLTPEEGQKLYNEFWQKAIAVLKVDQGEES